MNFSAFVINSEFKAELKFEELHLQWEFNG